jgi:hypothetical protein
MSLSNIRHNDIQHNDTQNNNKKRYALQKQQYSIVMLSVVFQCNAECHHADSHNGEFCKNECSYAESVASLTSLV